MVDKESKGKMKVAQVVVQVRPVVRGWHDTRNMKCRHGRSPQIQLASGARAVAVRVSVREKRVCFTAVRFQS